MSGDETQHEHEHEWEFLDDGSAICWHCDAVMAPSQAAVWRAEQAEREIAVAEFFGDGIDTHAAVVEGWAQAAEFLFTVLANVSGGDWTRQDPEWVKAASLARQNYHRMLKVRRMAEERARR